MLSSKYFRNLIIASYILISIHVFTIEVLAGAYDNHSVGLKGNSMGTAFTAIADDASAVFYNPAGLVMSEENKWQAELYALTIFTNFEYETCATCDKCEQVPVLPGMIISKNNGNWAFGCGFYVPFAGGGSKYKNFHNTGYNIEAGAGFADITSAVSFRLTDKLSIGSGLSIYMGGMENTMCLMDSKAEYALQKFKYEDTAGYGGHMGLMYKASDKISLGLNIRSPVSIKMDGHETVIGTSIIPSYKNKSNISFTFPYYFTLGFGYKPHSKITAGFDICYMLWSDMDKIKTRSDGYTNEIKTYYKNSFVIGLGLDYQVNEKLSLRGGLRFNQGATKDKGLLASHEPSLLAVSSNDIDLLIFSVGFAYQINQCVELDITGFYQEGFQKKIGFRKYDQDNIFLLTGFRFKF